MGVSLNKDMYYVFQQLIKKGFVPDNETDALLHGSFLGCDNVDIQLFPDESEKVCSAMLLSFHYTGTKNRERIRSGLENYLKANYKTKELGLEPDFDAKAATNYLCNKNGVEGIVKIIRYVSRGPLFDDETVDLVIIDKALAVKEYSKRKHLRFMDLAIDGSFNTFKAKLLAKGFTFVSTEKEESSDYNVSKFKGKFCGYNNCQILVTSHCSNDRVFQIEVIAPRQVSIPSTVLYKIHEAAVSFNNKVKGYTLNTDRENYITVIEEGVCEGTYIGEISLSIINDESVSVRFTDSASQHRLY